jgi:hypothetical protein
MAGPIDVFVGGCTKCMGIEEPPPLTMPGFPSFALGCAMTSFAGIAYVKDFIPPSPTNLPSPPSISIFIDPMLKNIALPDSYPGISFGPIKIPGKGADAHLSFELGSPPPPGISFDITGVFKLIVAVIMTVFKIFLSLIESIINLSPEIPGIALILKIFKEVGEQVQIPADVIVNFGACFAKSFLAMIKAVLPI